jgi:hypothetical protein
MSAQHAAVNFGQFDFYGFIPNRPMVLLKPMPTDKTALTDMYIVKVTQPIILLSYRSSS